MKYDVIIIGAGVAGLYAALHLPKDKKVLIINKGKPLSVILFMLKVELP